MNFVLLETRCLCSSRAIPSRTHLRRHATARLQPCHADGGDRSGPVARNRKPEWVRLLEDDADMDEDVARMLEGADGDPEKIRENMRLELQNKDFYVTREGAETPPKVAFRQVNPFKLWVWLEMYQPASSREQELLESVVKAWFMIGKLGGFNSGNLQVFHNADDDQSYFEYSNEELDQGTGSFMHDVGEVEFKGAWARFRVDMGTCDELAMDILINMLAGFSRDFCGLKRVYLGGVNKSWPVEEEEDEDEVDIDPMRLPEGVQEELELLDDIAPELEEQMKQQQRQRELLGKKLPGRPLPGTIEAAAADLRREGKQQGASSSSSGGGRKQHGCWVGVGCFPGTGTAKAAFSW